VNQGQKRQVAIRAARAQLRQIGCRLDEMTVQAAEQVLDELARTKPDLVAAQWFIAATANQWRLFCREWKAWHKELLRPITVYGYTVTDGTLVREIPAGCPVRQAPEVPVEECQSCGLDNKVHWCDGTGHKYCTKDILSLEPFEFDIAKWLSY